MKNCNNRECFCQPAVTIYDAVKSDCCSVGLALATKLHLNAVSNPKTSEIELDEWIRFFDDMCLTPDCACYGTNGYDYDMCCENGYEILRNRC